MVPGGFDSRPPPLSLRWTRRRPGAIPRLAACRCGFDSPTVKEVTGVDRSTVLGQVDSRSERRNALYANKDSHSGRKLRASPGHHDAVTLENYLPAFFSKDPLEIVS